MYKNANITAAFVLLNRLMNSESEDSALDLKYSDANPDQSDLFSGPGSISRPKSGSRSISRASSEAE